MEQGSRTRLATVLILVLVFGSGVLLGLAADSSLSAASSKGNDKISPMPGIADMFLPRAAAALAVAFRLASAARLTPKPALIAACAEAIALAFACTAAAAEA